MDDELQQLEAELKRLRPAAPAPKLVARIEGELARQPAHRPLAEVRWIWLAALPAAAAAMAIVFAQFSTQRAGGRIAKPSPIAQTEVVPAGEPSLKPVTAENVLVSAADEGLVTLEDGTPARRERLQYVDTVTWKNPRTNASLTWRVPREEVRVVPVVFQ
jgi:hypothetical protein